jgi:hypothetical protein
VLEQAEVKGGLVFVKLGHQGRETWWYASETDNILTLKETQAVEAKADGRWINGAPASAENQLRQVGNLQQIRGQKDTETGSLSIFEFMSTMTAKDTIVRTWKTAGFVDDAGVKVTVYYPEEVTATVSCAPA